MDHTATELREVAVMNNQAISSLLTHVLYVVASSQAVRRTRRHWTIFSRSSQHDGPHQRASATVLLTTNYFVSGMFTRPEYGKNENSETE